METEAKIMTTAIPRFPGRVAQQEQNRITKIIDDANHSRKGSHAALCQLFDQYPELAKVAGEIAERAEDSILETATGGNVLVKESMRRRLVAVRASLAMPGDGALEYLLVDRVALCYLALNFAEQLRADKWRPSISTEAADFWDRHISRLNGDFLKACKTLTLVRRLLRPTVAQMNIAERQVNILNTPAAE
jgi:hypothetical protein